MFDHRISRCLHAWQLISTDTDQARCHCRKVDRRQRRTFVACCDHKDDIPFLDDFVSENRHERSSVLETPSDVCTPRHIAYITLSIAEKLKLSDRQTIRQRRGFCSHDGFQGTHVSEHLARSTESITTNLERHYLHARGYSAIVGLFRDVSSEYRSDVRGMRTPRNINAALWPKKAVSAHLRCSAQGYPPDDILFRVKLHRIT